MMFCDTSNYFFWYSVFLKKIYPKFYMVTFLICYNLTYVVEQTPQANNVSIGPNCLGNSYTHFCFFDCMDAKILPVRSSKSKPTNEAHKLDW